jgi:hypothetical protein
MPLLTWSQSTSPPRGRQGRGLGTVSPNLENLPYPRQREILISDALGGDENHQALLSDFPDRCDRFPRRYGRRGHP